jgi:hypothetical protein
VWPNFHNRRNFRSPTSPPRVKSYGTNYILGLTSGKPEAAFS